PLSGCCGLISFDGRHGEEPCEARRLEPWRPIQVVRLLQNKAVQPPSHNRICPPWMRSWSAWSSRTKARFAESLKYSGSEILPGSKLSRCSFTFFCLIVRVLSSYRRSRSVCGLVYSQ